MFCCRCHLATALLLILALALPLRAAVGDRAGEIRAAQEPLPPASGMLVQSAIVPV